MSHTDRSNLLIESNGWIAGDGWGRSGRYKFPMRLLLTTVWAVVWLFTAAAWGQQAVWVDPYEVLYGNHLALASSPIPDSARRPSPELVALIEARTDILLAKAKSHRSLVPLLAPDAGVNDVAATKSSSFVAPSKEIVRARTQGRVFAAWQMAADELISDAYLASFLNTYISAEWEPIVADTQRRLAELQVKVDAFHARLVLVKPHNVSTLLALTEAYALWSDLAYLLRLGRHHPREFSRLIDGKPITEEEAKENTPFFFGPGFDAAVDWTLEEAEHLLQASFADKSTQTLRLEETALRALSRAYVESAAANVKLLNLRVEKQTKPITTAFESIPVTLRRILRDHQIEYGLEHRRDEGVEAVYTLLGMSFSAYRRSLVAYDEFEIQTAPVVWFNPSRDSEAKAQIAARNQLLTERFWSARRATALIRAAIGVVPLPVLHSLQTGDELRTEDIDPSEQALGRFIEAHTMSQLGVALLAPVPGSASRGAQSPLLPEAEQAAAVMRCIEELRSEEGGVLTKAQGLAHRQGWRVRNRDLDALIERAIFETCTRARFLNGNMSQYFWRVFKNAYVEWIREVEVERRGIPKLTQTCEDLVPSPEDELNQRESCTTVRRAMSQLSKEEREVLKLSVEDGLGTADIAAQLNISKEAAGKRVQRALARLRRAFQELDPVSLLVPSWCWAHQFS